MIMTKIVDLESGIDHTIEIDHILETDHKTTIMWYYILNEHWPLKQSIGRLRKHTVQNLHIISY